MNIDKLENLVMDKYLLELVRLRPEMKSFKTVEEIESFIGDNFSREELARIYEQVSINTIGDFEKAVFL